MFLWLISNTLIAARGYQSVASNQTQSSITTENTRNTETTFTQQRLSSTTSMEDGSNCSPMAAKLVSTMRLSSRKGRIGKRWHMWSTVSSRRSKIFLEDTRSRVGFRGFVRRYRFRERIFASNQVIR